ncbi:uncharacterized protein LOC129921362 [Episyrphus balteatus]|uniref:uncharacterized protein LOC129921362 n=1 Tax=Episyrphus balteatus TaxID=286459 RepID=UPI0024859124|nr:uncharacterized protein LOC129921362 [Episyrphus balteatus]
MSCQPPVCGRVSAIKSQFENLSGSTVPPSSSNSNKKNLLFQRTATSLDIPEKPKNLKCITVVPTSCSNSRIPTQLSRATQFKQVKSASLDSEVRLTRHTSDPVKRSSIKRSPAFRVGDKHNKAVFVKQNSLEPKELLPEKPARLESFLVRKCASDIDRLQQPGLTDSIRAALRRPLPSGPPPRKPPRVVSCGIPTTSTPKEREIHERLSLLENQLALRKKSKEDEEQEQEQLLPHGKKSNNLLQKAKTELVLHTRTSSSNLLDCLSCHKSVANIYDSVAPDERKPLTQNNSNSNSNSNSTNVIKRFSNSVWPSASVQKDEPIYMEPFAHLKKKVDKQSTTTTTLLVDSNNRCTKIDEVEERLHKTTTLNGRDMDAVSSSATEDSSVSDESLHSHSGGRQCACPEHHCNGGDSDVHYMCTAIDDSIEDSEGSATDGTNTSLGKSYDEITILVDAAFQNKIKAKQKMGNRSTDSDGKSSVRLSRTLTEKRKDYVRRISEIPDSLTSISKYGTLHRTLKAPILSSFKLEGEDDDDGSSDTSSDEDDDEPSMIPPLPTSASAATSQRIQHFNKLIEDNKTTQTLPPPTTTMMTTTTKTNNNNIKMRPKRSTDSPQIIKPPGEDHLDSTEAAKKAAEAAAAAADKEKEAAESQQSPKLFQVCMLVGYNMSTNTAYLKSKYPPNEAIPDNIEQLVFPHIDLVRTGKENQEYCLILTDDQNYKIYGYCRRVLPENSDTCLPLCYCIISECKALGFYQKLLKEVESRHGQTETEMNVLFSNLQRADIPAAGKCLHIKIPLFSRPVMFYSSKHMSLGANSKSLKDSLLASQESLSDTSSSATLNDSRRSLLVGSEKPFDPLVSRSLIRDPRYDEIFIRRPTDLRLENTELSELLICLGPEMLIDVFSNLLLERKVILQSCNISLLSKAILALQTMLYPFQWPYTIVTIVPSHLLEICQAPFPVLAGILDPLPFEIEDGAVVNLDTKKIIQTCGDEGTIIPPSLRKSLKVSLAMVDLIDKGKMLSSVLISEAFLRFFIELFGNYRLAYFDKEQFIQSHKSQNTKLFLEWFVETSMFRGYVNNRYKTELGDVVCDTSTEFYNTFDARLMEKSESNLKTRNMESILKGSNIFKKSKSKSFKKRLKEFFE